MPEMTHGSKTFDIDGFYAEFGQLHPPCADCPSFDFCADAELACQRFCDWVTFNIDSQRSRYPSKDYYKRLFGSTVRVSKR